MNTISDVAEKMGKAPVAINDYPGYVANRLLIPMINDAIYCLEGGVGSRESIDKIMKLGANNPMGSLELADLIGLDVCLTILEVLHAHERKYDIKPGDIINPDCQVFNVCIQTILK